MFFFHSEEASQHSETAGQVPKYKFTKKQKAAWQAFKAEAAEAEARQANQSTPSKELTELQKKCLEFCISLLDDKARFNPYECALVVAISVFGATQQGWRGPDTYAPFLSGIIKLARMMIVQHVMTEAGYGADDSDSSVRSLGDDKPDPMKMLRDMVNKFMIKGTHSP